MGVTRIRRTPRGRPPCPLIASGIAAPQPLLPGRDATPIPGTRDNNNTTRYLVTRNRGVCTPPPPTSTQYNSSLPR